jgi:hypothetical protein
MLKHIDRNYNPDFGPFPQTAFGQGCSAAIAAPWFRDAIASADTRVARLAVRSGW